jgi:hypothetical protein
LQPKEIELLLERHITLNSAIKRLPGWRIQLKSSTDRAEVIQTKIDFLTQFPDVKTYLTYQQPYYKFRLGDFTDKTAAYALMKQVNENFKGIFLVPDIVNVMPEGVIADRDDKFNFDVKEISVSEIRILDSIRLAERKKFVLDSLANNFRANSINTIPKKLSKTDSLKLIQRKKVVADSLARVKKTTLLSPKKPISKADSIRIAQRRKVVADSLARLKKTALLSPKKPLSKADSIRIAQRRKMIADSLARVKKAASLTPKKPLNKADSIRIAQRRKIIADSLARVKKAALLNPKKPLSKSDSIRIAQRRKVVADSLARLKKGNIPVKKKQVKIARDTFLETHNQINREMDSISASLKKQAATRNVKSK